MLPTSVLCTAHMKDIAEFGLRLTTRMLKQLMERVRVARREEPSLSIDPTELVVPEPTHLTPR